MQLTVQELMSLKEEIAQNIRKAERDCQGAATTITYQDGVPVNVPSVTFTQALTKLEKQLRISLEINDVLAKFNVEQEVASLVRKKKNLELLVRVIKEALGKAVEEDKNSYVTVGDTRVLVNTIVKPIIDVAEYKKTIREYLNDIAKIQAMIFKKNTLILEVSFEEKDLD